MSSPPAGTAGGSPGPGWYPDPSIPEYIRYWDGLSWVPGSSRPEPENGQPAPAPPEGVVPRAAPGPVASQGQAPSGSAPGGASSAVPPPSKAEETGPVYFDEDPMPPRPQEPGGSPAQAGPQAAGPAPLPELRGRGGVTPAADASAPAGPVPSAVDPRGAFLRPTGTGASASPGPATPTTPAAPPGPTAPAASGAGTPQAARGEREQTIGLRRTELPAGGSWARQVRELVEQGPEAGGVPVPAPRPEPVKLTPPARDAAPVVRQAAPQGLSGLPAPAPGPSGPPTAAVPQPAAPAAPWEPSPPPVRLFGSAEQAYPAGLGRRLLARLLDSLVPLAGAAAVAWPLVDRAREHIQQKVTAVEQAGVTRDIWLVDATTGPYLALVIGAFLVAGLLWDALPTALWGRTAGKALCGIRVLDLEGQEPPAFGAALRRWLVFGALAVVLIGVVNVAWCLRDRPWRQCWHDKAAGTYVAVR
ncbi:hypothetical protein GCM10009716_43970 [Streptomyces sodiiphilus]|uniref:RDD family protein n=1 Tax=Streptomyces sodiiphilus TaxID=226217 RepID=A0ABN2PU04_9ACTN